MREHFAVVAADQFQRDLDEKDWVILLRAADSGEIVGFSTLMTRFIDFEDHSYLVFFSGDTIVAPQHWGSPLLSRAWIALVLQIADQHPERIPYWMLISAGFRTYRFLSVFFDQFYPRYDHPTPPATSRLIDRFATEQYGDQYQREQNQPEPGIVRLTYPTPLRDHLSEIDPRRRKDPHIAFFHSANPGWASGDELVCLTRATRDNLTRAGRRMAGI